MTTAAIAGAPSTLDAGEIVSGRADPRYSQSVERGLAILRCFTAEQPVLGVSDVAKRLGLANPTAHRFMATLKRLGYVEQPGPGSKYQLAPHAGDVGMAAVDALPVRRHSLEVLEGLCERTGYTVCLGVLDGGEVLYVDRVRANRPGQHEVDLGVLGVRVGWRLPAHCCAMGKLLLAYLPEPDRRERVGCLELTRRGPNTITSGRRLVEDFQRIRAGSLAVSDGELAEGVLSIAAPVRDAPDAVIAALGVEAHVSMSSLEDFAGEVAPSLSLAADRLSLGLGCDLAEEHRS